MNKPAFEKAFLLYVFKMCLEPYEPLYRVLDISWLFNEARREKVTLEFILTRQPCQKL